MSAAPLGPEQPKVEAGAESEAVGAAMPGSTMRRDVIIALSSAIAGGIISAVVTLLLAYVGGYVTLDNKISQVKENDGHSISAIKQIMRDELDKLGRTENSLCDHLASMAEQQFETRCKQEKGKYDLNGHACIKEDGVSEQLPKVCPDDLYRPPQGL